MKIKSTHTPAIVHLLSGWYVVAGEVLEVDGVPHPGGYVPVPSGTRLEDIEFVRDEPEAQEKEIWVTAIKSSTHDGHYTVTYRPHTTSYTCTCDGFHYRKKCRHIEEAYMLEYSEWTVN